MKDPNLSELVRTCIRWLAASGSIGGVSWHSPV